jgi:hypothetical protein
MSCYLPRRELLRAFAAAFDAFNAIARCSFFVRALALAFPPLLPMLAKYFDKEP